MELTIRKGELSDIPRFLALLTEVRDTMKHKEWFYLDPPEFVWDAMKEGTMQLWVVMDGERMAAAFDLLHPGLAEYNYGYDLEFSEAMLEQVINMDSAAVHPDYRGLGLQRRLMETAEREIRGQGSRILLCTIHPDNCFSLNNAIKEGYAIQKKIVKFGSVRYLLRKDIT